MSCRNEYKEELHLVGLGKKTLFKEFIMYSEFYLLFCYNSIPSPLGNILVDEER